MLPPLLHALHWLPIQARIDYKLCTLCFNFFSGRSPAYFSELLSKYSIGREGNRSDKDNRTLISPKRDIHYITIGERSFSFCAPEVWNSLPFEVRHKDSVASFKSALKTYLFRNYYPWIDFFCATLVWWMLNDCFINVPLYYHLSWFIRSLFAEWNEHVNQMHICLVNVYV